MIILAGRAHGGDRACAHHSPRSGKRRPGKAAGFDRMGPRFGRLVAEAKHKLSDSSPAQRPNN
jgi:hypothetical protein